MVFRVECGLALVFSPPVLIQAGEHESAHFNNVATKITLILKGTLEMCGRRLRPGDIIKLSPGETTSFTDVTDTTTDVVKLPSILDDKFAASRAL